MEIWSPNRSGRAFNVVAPADFFDIDSIPGPEKLEIGFLAGLENMPLANNISHDSFPQFWYSHDMEDVGAGGKVIRRRNGVQCRKHFQDVLVWSAVCQ